jgi:hypothetical protein
MFYISSLEKQLKHISRKSLPFNNIYELCEIIYEHYPVRSNLYVRHTQFVSYMKHGLNTKGFQSLALQSDDLAQVLYLCRSEWLIVCGQS